MAQGDPGRPARFKVEWKNISALTPLYLILAVFGSPFYNVLAFLFCHALGFYKSTGFNSSQVSPGAYFLFLLIVFILRSLWYQTCIRKYLRIQANSLLFLDAFTQRHLPQALGLPTLIWSQDLEANVLGFAVIPFTFLALLVVSPLTTMRIFSIEIRMEKLMQRKVGSFPGTSLGIAAIIGAVVFSSAYFLHPHLLPRGRIPAGDTENRLIQVGEIEWLMERFRALTGKAPESLDELFHELSSLSGVDNVVSNTGQDSLKQTRILRILGLLENAGVRENLKSRFYYSKTDTGYILLELSRGSIR